MPSFDDLRRLALRLPEVAEIVQPDGALALQANGRTFAVHWGERVILKLDRHHQEILFDLRPETFRRCKVAMGYWSDLAIETVDEAELAALVREAWETVAPKRAIRALEAGEGAGL